MSAIACSASRPRRGPVWPRWFPTAGVVVAESLRRLPDPGLVGWPDPPPATGAGVTASITAALAPPLAPDPPPAWLRPAQVEAFRRTLAAVRRFGGALLAEPVGTGKTWIALAVAAAEGGEAACVVPAVLREQWAGVARRAGIPITLTTHEQWSRSARALGRGLVIVDESHRFRTPGIRRGVHLAPALVGRRGILLAATPVVNRLEDLATQLLLLIRDDALAPSGIRSLRAALRDGRVPHALAELLVSGTTDNIGRPDARESVVRATADDGDAAAPLLRAIDHLRLSGDRSTRRLLRGVFTALLASSPAALLAGLVRYRLLLEQSRDAGAAGHTPSRGAIRRVLAGDLEQMVLWPLLHPDSEPGDLIEADLPALDRLIRGIRSRLAARDHKLEQLRVLLADGTPTVIFSGSRATVRHLRTRLEPRSRIAWCTGEASGIGPARLSRERVLRWFRPGNVHELAPTVLVTTDLAAEGLDLQRAGRVVHYDLPWTPARLEQRAGRARRLGGELRAVEIVRFEPPRLIERRLRQLATLERKGRLPARVGLGSDADPVWSWRARVARRFAAREAVPGITTARSTEYELLAGADLMAGPRVLSSWAAVRDRSGRWSTDAGVLERALEQASAGRRTEPTGAELIAVRRALEPLLRPLVRDAAGALWGLGGGDDVARRATARLQRLARAAVRRRDRDTLSGLEAALGFLRRGHTTGERMLVEQLASGDEDPPVLPITEVPHEIPPPIRVRLTGLVLFRPG